MRVAGGLALLLTCVALTGCSHFGKRSTAANQGVRPSLDTNPPAPDPVTATPATGATAIPASANTGILAGQILDGYQRKPPPAYIQVSRVREGNETAAAPLEVAADSQGYFTIQGLQPGRHYQLIARARDGEQLLAGTTYAVPPNPRVVIRISSEFAGGSTPPVPPAPAIPRATVVPDKGGAAPPPSWPSNGSRGDQGWSPERGAPATAPRPDPRRPAGLGAPIAIDENPTPATDVPVSPERISSGPPVARRDQQPANIRNPAAPVIAEGGATEQPVPAAAGEAPIPFCSLTGRQLHNFGLYDLNGKTWEFRQRRNKLTLIEFWGTWCIYCQHSIPHLNVLQQKYGQHGLEVVGIAYENGPVEQHADQVRRVAERLKINYTLLLGGDRLRCPVRSQFRVGSWPTFFLIDSDGKLIWQEAGLDKQKVVELERLIRQQLGVR